MSLQVIPSQSKKILGSWVCVAGLVSCPARGKVPMATNKNPIIEAVVIREDRKSKQCLYKKYLSKRELNQLQL
jgi:hypothetical protein